MAKIDNPDSILASGESVIPTPGGDDFLSRINASITNFKEVLKIAQQLKGAENLIPTQNPDRKGDKSLPPPNPMAQVVQLIVAMGYGDTPLGELINKVSPYTIKQLVSMAGKFDVGPKQ